MLDGWLAVSCTTALHTASLLFLCVSFDVNRTAFHGKRTSVRLLRYSIHSRYVFCCCWFVLLAVWCSSVLQVLYYSCAQSLLISTTDKDIQKRNNSQQHQVIYDK